MALTDNIIAYWELDESSGNAADSVGGFTLTNNNTATYSAGIIGNGVDLELSSAQNLTSISSIGINGGAVTISAWVKVESPAPSGADERRNIVMIQDDTSDVSYIFWYRYDSGLKLGLNRLKNGVADDILEVAQTLTTGTWYHVVYTYNATNGEVYLNASSIAGPTAQSGSGSGTTTDGIAIGRSIQGARTDYWDGMIDEVGVWSRALTSDEITELYNSGTGLQYPFTTSFVPQIIII